MFRMLQATMGMLAETFCESSRNSLVEHTDLSSLGNETQVYALEKKQADEFEQWRDKVFKVGGDVDIGYERKLINQTESVFGYHAIGYSALRLASVDAAG